MKNAAIALVVTTDQKILLVQRHDVPVWVLPGGGIEEGEDPEDTAVRETEEETGLVVKAIQHVATYVPINHLSSTTYVYLCAPTGEGALRLQASETEDIRFFPLSALPKTLFFLHETWITEWQNSSSFPIQRPLSELRYVSLLFYLCQHPWWILRYFWTRWTKDL